MKAIRSIIQFLYRYRYLISYLVLATLAVLAFSYRLGDLTPGPSDSELNHLSAAQGLEFKDILSNVVNLPHLLISAVIDFVFSTSLIGMRVSSILFAATMLPMFYLVLRTWHSRRIAIIGMMILIGSGWFIGLARLGDGAIMYSWGVMAALYSSTVIFHHARWGRNREWMLLSAGLALGLSLYAPYAIYIYLLGLLLLGKSIKRLWTDLYPRLLLVLFIPVAIVVLPLVASVILHPSQLLQLIGIPSEIPTIETAIEALKNTFSEIFWRTDGSSLLSLGRLPHLGIFGATMVALGMIHYEQHRRHIRTNLTVGAFFLFLVILSFGPTSDATSAMLPLIYIFISMGIITLLVQWYKIFPRNPLAKRLGLVLAAVLVLVSLSYENERYFRAWANAPKTKTLFSDDVIKVDDYLSERPPLQTWVIVDPGLLTRFESWFYHRQDQVLVTSAEALESAEATASLDWQLVIIQCGILKPPFLTERFTLDEAISTTSLTKPTNFEVYLPNNQSL